MARRAMFVAVLLGGAGLAVAQKSEKKRIFPALVTHARYVYVTTMYGDPLSASVRIPPEDRQAAAEVQGALRKWGRYILVYRPQVADLTLVVRRGRIASAKVGAVIRTNPGGTSAGPVFGGEASNIYDDLLFVYDARNGTDTPALLKYVEKDGLEPPDLKLVGQFRKEVEQAEKEAAKKTATKP